MKIEERRKVKTKTQNVEDGILSYLWDIYIYICMYLCIIREFKENRTKIRDGVCRDKGEEGQ